MIKVIGLDSNTAVTVFYSVDLPHQSRGEINEADLENYLSKAVWKSFDALRSLAAGRLNVEEADLVLAGVRVVGIKVDGHEVISAHGFAGKNVQISLCITMVKRGVTGERTAEEKESVEMLETGSVAAYLLSRKLNIPNLLYVEPGEEVTSFFYVSPGGAAHIREFVWGRQDIIKIFGDNFAVPEEAAWSIYHKFLAGNLSEPVTAKLEKLFAEVFKRFMDGATLSLRDVSTRELKKLPPIYIKMQFPLPDAIGKKSVCIGNRRARLCLLQERINIEDLAYNTPYVSYEWLNSIAKRRIKWLMP
ncbi:MAG: hypothetical protein AAB659_01555 [Patescibacteria group bacterium]